MKKTLRFLCMAALALVGAVLTGCSGSDDNITGKPQQPANTDNVVTLTTTISLDGSAAATRALTSGGVKTFAAGERMALVYKNTGGTTVKVESAALKTTDITDGGKSGTFTFNLTNPDETQPVTYIYPAAMANADGTVSYAALSAQDGTLTTLSSNLDLATYTAAWNGASLPEATLDNQLAILALTLKNDATGSDITGSITGLTISDGTNSYAVTRPAAAGPIYVAIRPTSSASITVTATDGSYNYSKSLTGKTYAASNIYNLGWRMTNVTPLTMEALTDGTIVVDKPREGMQYSKNSGAKTAVTSDAIDVEAGDKVQFYGNSATYYSGSSDYTTIAGGTAEVKVYGNIMSLVDETGYADATTLTAENENTFRRLFYNNTKLTNASGLLLPATTLQPCCYQGMFNGCTSLTAAPTLPATTLADYCYRAMFYGCTSLTTAPTLPAKTMKESCYLGMFYGCTSLTTAPALPATTLDRSCYREMFSGCTSLTTAPTLPATTLAASCYREMFSGCTSLTNAPTLSAKKLSTNCYHGMFSGCTGLTTAPALLATTLDRSCYHGMFSGCTSLTTAPTLSAKYLAVSCYSSMFYDCTSLTAAPTLPATKLVNECYRNMFGGCTRLSAVTCLATNISADDCTYGWLYGVAESGTFTTPSSTNWEIDSPNGIPSGWTRLNAQ